MGEIDWRHIIAFSQKELSSKKKEKIYESIAWMDADDIEINFGDLKSLFLMAQDMMKFKADQVDTLTGQIDAMVQRETYNEKGDDTSIQQIVQQEEEIKANKDILDQLYRDIASLQEHKDKKQNMDKESTSSKDPLSELNDIKELEMTISLKNEHLKKMLADLQTSEADNVNLREKLTNIKEKLSEATKNISYLTDQVSKLRSQSTQLKGKIAELGEQKSATLVDLDRLRQELREHEALKNATIEELKLNIVYWKDCSSEKQSNIDQMMEEISALKTQLKCLKDDTYLAQTVKQYKHQIKSLQTNLAEASREIENSANVIEKLKLENKDMKEAVKSQTGISDATTDLTVYCSDLHLTKVRQKLQSKLAGAREMIQSREQEIADLSGQIQILYRDDGVKCLIDKIHQQKRQLKIRDEHIKSLVSEINSVNEAIDNLQLENVTMREKLNLQPEEKVSTVGILGKFNQTKKRAKVAERKLAQLEESYLTLQLQTREEQAARGVRRRRQQGNQQPSGLDGGGDAPSYLSLPQESRSGINPDVVNGSVEMQNLIDENDGLRKGLHEIWDFIKESVIGGKSIVEIGSESLDKVTASLDARHAAGWFAPHLATATHLQRAIGARDALSTALNQVRKEAYEVIDKLAKESQKTCDLENKLLELQKDKIELNTVDYSHEQMQNCNFGNRMTDDVFNALDLEENNLVQDVILKSVNKNYVLRVREALAHFHNQFNSLYKQMTDLSIRMSEEQQKWGLREEQHKAEIENLQSQIASTAYDDESNSDHSAGAVHLSKVVLQRRCTYLEESFRSIRTENENFKNEYFASEKDKLVKIGNYESQIQILLINITSFSDQLRNSVPLDFFLKQNCKYNELNMKYRNLLNMQMQENDITQNIIKSDEEIMCKEHEAMEKDKKQVIELPQAERQQNINYAPVRESANKHVKKMTHLLDTDNYGVAAARVEQEHQTCDVAVIRGQLDKANRQIEDATKYTRELEKKLLDFHERQKDFVDGALSSSCISREQYNQMTLQCKEHTRRNETLNMDMAKVTTELEITTLQLDELRQRQFCNDTEVNMLRHQILDLQSRGDNEAVIARLGGEVLVSQFRAADMQRRLERVWCELRHEQRRRRQAEQRRTDQETAAQMHASTYHFRLGFINEVLQVLREQYDGSLPIVSLENYVDKLNFITTRNQELETVKMELEELKVTCQAKTDGYNQIISAAQCGLKENDCPHYLQLMLNKLVGGRELEHCRHRVQSLEEIRLELSTRCARLEKSMLTLSHCWRQQPELQLLDVTSPSPSPTDEDVSLNNETQILSTPRILSCPDGPEQGTAEKSIASPQSLHTQTVHIGNNKRPDAVTNATVQTEPVIYKNLSIQTEKIFAESQTERDLIQINSLTQNLAEKKREFKTIVNRTESEKLNLQREVKTLTQRDNEKKQYIEKLVQQISNLNEKISQLQNLEVEFKQKMVAVKEAEKKKEHIMDECREMLKKERKEYESNAAASQKKIEELQNDLDKLIIESNDLRAALLQPTSLKAVSDIVDKYTGRIASLEEKCLKLQDVLDTCKSELVSSQAEAERWKTLSMERCNKLETLNAKLEERHRQEVEWYRAESCHLLQQLSKSEHTLSELRQLTARQRRNELQPGKQLEVKIPLSESDLKLDETSRVESPLGSVCEVPPSESHAEHLSLQHQGDLPDRSMEGSLNPTGDRSSSQSKSVRLKEQSLLVRGSSTATLQQSVRTDTYLYSEGQPAASVQDLNNTALELRKSAGAAHVAMWEKWKMCERSVQRWRGKCATQQQQVKVLQARLTSARAVVQRLQKEKRVLLDRGRDGEDCNMSRTISSSRVVSAAGDTEVPHIGRNTVTCYCGSPHMSTGSLLARVEAQQRRIAALQLATKGNETLLMEYERLLAKNTQLTKLNLKLESQVLESQLSAGGTGAPADKVDNEIKHLRRYVEMLKEENAELRMGVGARSGGGGLVYGGSARTTATESPGARTEDLQRTVLTLRALVAKLQAENKHLLTQKRNYSDLHCPAEKDEVLPEDLLRAENSHLKKSLLEKESLLQRAGDVLRRAAQREAELLQQISSLESMLECGRQTTSDQ